VERPPSKFRNSAGDDRLRALSALVPGRGDLQPVLGSAVVLAPELFLDLVGIEPPPVSALGKILGILGFMIAVGLGQLPASFGVIVLTNDVIWLPAFLSFVVSIARRTGWRALALGD
jgi:hypothetical protein